MNTHIHRLLDEAFDGIEMTADARDLKEELRANLLARCEELEAEGVAPADAARTAIAELGSIADLLGVPSPSSAPAAAAGATGAAGASGASGATGATGASGASASRAVNHNELFSRNKVRPKPGFVVRTTLLSVAAAAAIALAVLAAFDVVGGGVASVVGLGLAAAAVLGFVTADSLSQETSSNYAMPIGRATLWGIATFAGIAALVMFGAFAVNTSAVALVVAGSALAFASIGLFSWLGASQTNRHKAWVRELGADYSSHAAAWSNPEASARYGMYAGAIWITGLAAAVALAIAVAWWWAPIVFVATIVLTMLVQATMMHRSSND